MIELTIDNINIWEGYNCNTLHGTLAGLLSPSASKKMSFTDWPESHGIDPDLMTFSLEARTFDVHIYAPSLTVAQTLRTILAANNGAHTLGMTGTPISITARVSVIHTERIGNAYIFKVTFTEDLPSYSGVAKAGGFDYGYKLDGVPLGNYGIDVLDGTSESVFTPSRYKQNLTITSAHSSGQTYDTPGGLVLATKSCRLRLRIEQSVSNAVNSYYAFLRDLTAQGSHILTAKHKGLTRDFPIYYKNGKIVDCRITKNRLWIEFDIELEQYKGYGGE